MRPGAGVVAMLMLCQCARQPPTAQRSQVPSMAPPSVRPSVRSSMAPSATAAVIPPPAVASSDADAGAPTVLQPLPSRPLSSWGTEEQTLAIAKDPTQSVGSRIAYLQIYARQASEAGHGAEAARVIFALRGKIVPPANSFFSISDPVYEAMTYTRSASAIPLLLSTGELQHCKGGEVPVHHAGLDALRDPDATVVIDVSPAFSMIALVGLLVQDNPDSPEAAAAVPDFVRALRCGDERIRMMSGQAIGNVHRLSAANAAALRELLHHPRANTRALSATLLALSSDTVTIAALEKALADPDESVQLNAAHALAREHRSPKALPVLRRLTASKTGDIAQVARQALTEDEAASK